MHVLLCDDIHQHKEYFVPWHIISLKWICWIKLRCWPSGKLPFECKKIVAIFLKKKDNFWQFFDIQMAIFQRVSWGGLCLFHICWINKNLFNDMTLIPCKLSSWENICVRIGFIARFSQLLKSFWTPQIVLNKVSKITIYFLFCTLWQDINTSSIIFLVYNPQSVVFYCYYSQYQY